MHYLGQGGSLEEMGIGWKRYEEYLDSIEHELPANARTFARASWHYDPVHHRGLHDSWVEELSIQETRGEDRQSFPDIAIHLRLLGAYHDGHATLIYSGVRRYQLTLDSETSRRPPLGHWDWLVDEVRLSDRKLVVHEILFASEARWIIECADILYATSIPDVRDNR
jgi:hypothetical protein